MVAILEKTEHNADFHQIVDFLEASPLRYALLVHPTIYVSHIRQFWSIARIETADEETHIVDKINGEQVTISESSIRRKLKLKDEEGISNLPDTDLFENLSRMGYTILPNQSFSFQKETYPVPSQTAKVFTTLRVNSPSFSGRHVDLFECMLVPQGEGLVNPTEPHHTPSPQPESPPQIEHTIPTDSQEMIPEQIQSSQPQAMQLTLPETQTISRTSVPQTTNIPSQTPKPRAYELLSLSRDDRHGEAFPTASSLDAGQDRENIPKTSAMPHESSPRVTSLGGDEGNLEISQLKARIKTLEDAQKIRGDVQEDAPNRGGIMDQGEEFGIERDNNKSTDKGSESTGEMANILSFMGATNILDSGGLKEVFTTASPQVAPASVTIATADATASVRDPTAEVSTTTKAITSYTRRARDSRGIIFESSQPSHTTSTPTYSSKGKQKMTEPEPEKPTKKKAHEQMSEQLARELKQEFSQEDQAIREQIERDAEIARIQAKEDLRQMINELDRSNEMINKHMAEYEEAENDLTIKEKTELISELIEYQKDLAGIKKYQAQQQKLASKTERRKFYTSILRSHAGWKTKDFKVEVQKAGTLLEKMKAKRLKTDDGLAKEKESSVDITPNTVKSPIYDWKIIKDKLREVYRIFRVREAPKVYPYFDTMLKNFDREDVETLWKLVKDRFKEELPKSDQEKCIFWPLRIMFEPIATNLIWQFDAPIKSWKLFKTCRVHCLTMEGMIIYMLDDVEYPLPKSTLQKMLDHKCELYGSHCQKVFLLLVVSSTAEFPLPEDLPLLHEDKYYCRVKDAYYYV
ncbi:hypothetical protein Tco_0432671 [Tanacetum coccineum]